MDKLYDEIMTIPTGFVDRTEDISFDFGVHFGEFWEALDLDYVEHLIYFTQIHYLMNDVMVEDEFEMFFEELDYYEG